MGYKADVALLEKDTSKYNLNRFSQLFYKTTLVLPISTNNIWESPPHILDNRYYHFLKFLMNLKWSHYYFHLHFSTSEFTVFFVFIGHLDFPFSKVFIPFDHFLLVFYSLLPQCESSLYIIAIEYLSLLCNTNTFSESITY